MAQKSKVFNQTLVSLVANVGGLMFGISLGWSAPVSEYIIENKDYPFLVTSVEFGWVVAMMPLGAACSCIFSGILRKCIGTKLTFFAFGFPIVIGYVLLIIPQNLSMIIQVSILSDFRSVDILERLKFNKSTYLLKLMVGRFLIGISSGCYMYLLPMYNGELASNEIRGVIGSLYHILANFGILFVFIVGYFVSVFVLNIVCAVIPIVYSIVFLFLPETPSMLVNKNRIEDAITAIKFLRGKNFDCNKEIEELKIQKQLQGKNFKEIFIVKSTRKAFTMMMILFVFFQMSGINVMLFYSTMIFTEAQVTLDPGVSSIIVAGVQIAASFITTVLVDRFGRKVLYNSSYAIMCASMFGIVIYFRLQEAGSNVSSINWLPLTSFSFYLIAFSFGMAPITDILIGEMFSLDAKPYIAPVCQVLSFSLTFLLGLFFPMLIGVIGFGYTFIIFALFTFVGTIYVIFCVPETKGKSLYEIQNMLS